ncbi:UNKNOWN [Stylonychia lemnae]|uniref:Morn repeat protein n=1 Tax=Stylonychia lemnae TaxID=5949 RepID=A0A078AM83_STYLE|nr:UNKNOWN [Stylonychia lemnae]|eukprot:CDW83006.1 UNKNOWN [Stylonychia lemnae]
MGFIRIEDPKEEDKTISQQDYRGLKAGMIISYNLATYQGKILNNKREGFGEETYPDGNLYKGNYHNDLRFGSGIMTYSLNRRDYGTIRYDGQWMNNKKQGHGRGNGKMEVKMGWEDQDLLTLTTKEKKFKISQKCFILRLQIHQEIRSIYLLIQIMNKDVMNRLHGQGQLQQNFTIRLDEQRTLDFSIMHIGQFENGMRHGFGVSMIHLQQVSEENKIQSYSKTDLKIKAHYDHDELAFTYEDKIPDHNQRIDNESKNLNAVQLFHYDDSPEQLMDNLLPFNLKLEKHLLDYSKKNNVLDILPFKKNQNSPEIDLKIYDEQMLKNFQFEKYVIEDSSLRNEYIDFDSILSVMILLNSNQDLLEEIFIYSKVNHHWVCLKLFNDLSIVEVPIKVRYNDSIEKYQNIDANDTFVQWIPLICQGIIHVWKDQNQGQSIKAQFQDICKIVFGADPLVLLSSQGRMNFDATDKQLFQEMYRMKCIYAGLLDLEVKRKNTALFMPKDASVQNCKKVYLPIKFDYQNSSRVFDHKVIINRFIPIDPHYCDEKEAFGHFSELYLIPNLSRNHYSHSKILKNLKPKHLFHNVCFEFKVIMKTKLQFKINHGRYKDSSGKTVLPLQIIIVRDRIIKQEDALKKSFALGKDEIYHEYHSGQGQSIDGKIIFNPAGEFEPGKYQIMCEIEYEAKKYSLNAKEQKISQQFDQPMPYVIEIGLWSINCYVQIHHSKSSSLDNQKIYRNAFDSYLKSKHEKLYIIETGEGAKKLWMKQYYIKPHLTYVQIFRNESESIKWVHEKQLVLKNMIMYEIEPEFEDISGKTANLQEVISQVVPDEEQDVPFSVSLGKATKKYVFIRQIRASSKIKILSKDVNNQISNLIDNNISNQ